MIISFYLLPPFCRLYQEAEYVILQCKIERFVKVPEIFQRETEGYIPMDETALLPGQTVEAHGFIFGTLKQFFSECSK